MAHMTNSPAQAGLGQPKSVAWGRSLRMKNAARAIWPPAQRVVPSEDGEGEEEEEAEAEGRQTTAWSVIHLPINALFNIPAAVGERDEDGGGGGSARCRSGGSRGEAELDKRVIGRRTTTTTATSSSD